MAEWGVLSTEASNPASEELDTLAVEEVVSLLLEEDVRGVEAAQRSRDSIARAACWLAEALEGGGRVVFAGAGTSGRLGILEAAECPPTFGTPPHLFQGIIAGGPCRAVFEMLGVQDVVAKSIGSQNPYNMIRATIDGLQKESSPRMVAQRRGKKVADILNKGDAPAAIAASPHRVEGRFEIGGQEHFYLEGQAALAAGQAHLGDEQLTARRGPGEPGGGAVLLDRRLEMFRMGRADAVVDIETVGFVADGDDLGPHLVEHVGERGHHKPEHHHQDGHGDQKQDDDAQRAEE